MTALTDQAIAKIKDLIMSGEFSAGSKLPNEQDLSQRLGLSRNSLREAVRALSLARVLEVRQGDGTYVSSLEPDLLLESTSFVSHLLLGDTAVELYEVRRILEAAAAALAAARIDEVGKQELARRLEGMTAAESVEELVEADVAFHAVIAKAAGNGVLMSLLASLSTRTMRVRLWRGRTVDNALDVTRDERADEGGGGSRRAHDQDQARRHVAVCAMAERAEHAAADRLHDRESGDDLHRQGTDTERGR